jgi:anti-sigma factor RsiW
MDYLAESLSVSERAVFEHHLGECPDCVAYLSTYRQTIELGKAACRADDPVPADAPEELVQAILAARRRNPNAPQD